MIASAGVMPESTSISVPKSRPSVMLFRCTRWSLPTRRHLQVLRAKHHGIHRHAQGVEGSGQLEMHLRIGAGQQLAAGVVDLQLDLQRARDRIERVRGAGDGRGVTPARMVGELEGGGDAGADGGSIRLRHLHVDAQPMRIGDAKQRLPGLWPAPALISAPMSVLRAVMTPSKGATHPLEGLQLAAGAPRLAAADCGAAVLAAASPAR